MRPFSRKCSYSMMTLSCSVCSVVAWDASMDPIFTNMSLPVSTNMVDSVEHGITTT